jgi:hypothetical protein
MFRVAIIAANDVTWALAALAATTTNIDGENVWVKGSIVIGALVATFGTAWTLRGYIDTLKRLEHDVRNVKQDVAELKKKVVR